MTPLVSIILATVDPADEPCAGCLHSLRLHTPEPFEMCMVWNPPHAPQGYTRPVNAAVRASTAPYLMLLNDDTRVCPGWWPPLQALLDAGATVAFPREASGGDWDDGRFNMWGFAITRATMQVVEWRPGHLFDEAYRVHNADTALLDRITRRWQPARPVAVADASMIHHLHGRTTFGNALIRGRVGEWIAEDTRLREQRFAANGGCDELPWVPPTQASPASHLLRG